MERLDRLPLTARNAFLDRTSAALLGQRLTRPRVGRLRFEGSFADGIREARKHRQREHPEREVEKKGKKPKP